MRRLFSLGIQIRPRSFPVSSLRRDLDPNEGIPLRDCEYRQEPLVLTSALDVHLVNNEKSVIPGRWLAHSGRDLCDGSPSLDHRNSL